VHGAEGKEHSASADFADYTENMGQSAGRKEHGAKGMHSSAP